MPPPAPVSTVTSCPAATYSRTAPGVSPTRYSCTLISLGTPTRIPGLLLIHLHDRSDVPGLVSCKYPLALASLRRFPARNRPFTLETKLWPWTGKISPSSRNSRPMRGPATPSSPTRLGSPAPRSRGGRRHL